MTISCPMCGGKGVILNERLNLSEECEVCEGKGEIEEPRESD